MSPITVDNHLRFTLKGNASSYSFFVADTGDLNHLHFGGSTSSAAPGATMIPDGGWCQGPPTSYPRAQREFPDNGNGDYSTPAIRIRHGKGTTVTRFVYDSHEVTEGKSGLKGLPATFGDAAAASTLKIRLKDDIAELYAVLSYTVFPAHDAYVRSFTIENRSGGDVTIQAASSFSVDLGHSAEGREMIQLSGEWAREAQIIRRTVHHGLQGIQSLAGFSSHLHNPFLGIVSPDTTETAGEAYGFSLVYTGSFSASVERGPTGLDRVLIGMNPLQLDWTLKPGEIFDSPEAVAVYSCAGLGQMSRQFHRLYRDHLSRSPWTHKQRPVLINNWEGTYFDFDEEKIYNIAQRASELGCSLTVLDDGWFGTKYPRNNDDAGLGDWKVNEQKLKGGLDTLVKRIGKLKNAHGGMKFGLWVEPEHVNPKSELFDAHPEWTLHAAANSKEYPRVERRNQFILNLSLVEVQDYIIRVIGDILASTDIAYVKWDCNKGIEQLATPSEGHAYILGIYRVIDALTTRFPDILWEGCASGGGRFDPGILHYWPGSWTSDNTDPVDRLHIQTGTSLVYPPSSMSGHVSASPNHQTGRETPLEFRGHVAMLCGSFGFELDPASFTEEENKIIPAMIELSERISPYIIQGDLYRLARPELSNWPAFMYVNKEGSAVLLAFQIYNKINTTIPAIRLQGLEAEATYTIDGAHHRGDTLMSAGLRLPWKGDYQSKVIFVDKA